MKYDKIVEIRKNKSQQKIEIAKREINKMLERKEKISVTALVKYTGLSEGFFYKNPEVRKALNDALLQQGESYNPKKVIFDMAMEQTILMLKAQIVELKKELKNIKKENIQLKEKNMILEEICKELQDELMKIRK